jgi:CheY-like chemotaxis protein
MSPNGRSRRRDEPVDLQDVLERLEGDRALLDELLGLFLEDCPPKLAGLRQALETEDMEAVRLLGHAVKGAAANLSLGPIREASHRIERAGQERRVAEAGKAVKALEAEFERLKAHLSSPALPAAESRTEAVAKPGAPNGTPRVLAVDDARDSRALMTAWAGQAGIDLDTAADGPEALRLVKAGSYSLVLLDLNLPRKSGFEILADIRRAEKRLGRTPARIVALTASSAPGEEEKCRAAGFDGFLVKPVAKGRFQALLLEAVGANPPAAQSIAADDFLSDLIPGYLKNRKRDWRNMDAALKKRDFGVLESTAHQIKGSAASFGFARMGEIARDLEAAARDKRADEAARALQGLKAELDGTAKKKGEPGRPAN